jgi:hypothetical protein
MPKSERNAASEMTKREFAEVFGMSEKNVERFCQQGMQHRKDGKLVFITMPQGRIWYHNYLVEKGKREAAPKTINEAVRRQEAARADREELALAKEMAKTMLVEDHERLLADAFGRVRAKLLALPPRCAGTAFGAATMQECQAKIEPLVTEIMEELAAADDVPDEDQAA